MISRGFFMRCFVYIIYSASSDQYYIGSAEDIDARLYRHNHSGSKSTKKASDSRLVPDTSGEGVATGVA
jgi:putative endonuclease